MAAKKKANPRKKKAKKRINKEDQITRRVAISALLIAIVGITAFLFYKNYFREPQKFESSKYVVKGIDISHHQPIINWEMVSEQDIYFGYIKATESVDHLDRNYIYNYEQAREAQVKIGSYHFFRFGVSGRDQAQHFIRTAKCQSGDMIPAIDVEHSTINTYSDDTSYIAMIKHELMELESALYEHYGVRPLIYTNKDCYKLYIKDSFPDNPLWICDLHKEPSDDINWKIWQFSHSGKLPGVNEKIDLNYYRYSFDEFKELLLP